MILPNDFVFTQANLQDYVDCPYRFYLRYVLRTRWPALVVDQALDFEQRGQAGGRFHRLVQQYLLGVPAERIEALAEEDPWPELRAWWAGFLTHVPPWLVGQRWVEMPLTATLVGQRLLAKYDLLLVEEQGNLTIFDWKTSEKPLSKARLLERIQTRLYRLVLLLASPMLLNQQPAAPEQISMHYWYATHPQTPIYLIYSQADFDRDREYLAHLVETVANAEVEDFLRTADLARCRFCVYRSHCERGVEAGSLEEFDRLELELDDPDRLIDFDDLPEIEF